MSASDKISLTASFCPEAEKGRGFRRGVRSGLRLGVFVRGVLTSYGDVERFLMIFGVCRLQH